MAVLVVFGLSLCVCCGGVACVCWWLGGNCYHRRCFAACRRRVGGLWSQNPRVVAQSAVHLGGMRVTWGVWGVVDDGLGVVVRGEAFLWCGVSGMSGLSACCRDDRAHCRRLSRGAVVGLIGEWWPVRAQAGPLGGGVDGLPGLPLVGLTCAVEGLVLPPDTPSDHLRCPGRQVRSGRPTGAELPPLPPLPASPEPRVVQDVSGNTRGPLACASQNPTGAGKGPSVAWGDADGPQTQHEAHKPSEGRSRARRRPIVPRQFVPVDQPRVGVVAQGPRPQ